MRERFFYLCAWYEQTLTQSWRKKKLKKNLNKITIDNQIPLLSSLNLILLFRRRKREKSLKIVNGMEHDSPTHAA